MKLLKSRVFKWAVTVLVLLAVVALIALHVLTPKQASVEQLANEMKVQAQLTGAAKTYAASCAHCHDAGIGPTLRGRGLPPEVVSIIVRNGVGAMPGFKPSSISDAELAELAGYVSKLPAAGKP